MPAIRQSADGLKLWQRIVLIGLAGTVPLLVVATVLTRSNYGSRIALSAEERRGVETQRPMMRLLDALARYQITGDSAHGPSPALAASRGRIDSLLGIVAAIYASPRGKSLRLDDSSLVARGRGDARLSVLTARWDSVRRKAPVGTMMTSPMNTLTASVRLLISQVGDQSFLILDDDLDAYYLADLTTQLIPENQGRLATAASRIAGWARAGEFGRKADEAYAMEAMLRVDDVGRILREERLAVAEDPNYRGISPSLQANLPPATEAFRLSNTTFFDAVTRARAGSRVSGESFEAEGLDVMDAGARLWDVAATELDTLLVRRIEWIQRERLRDYAIIGVTLLLALVVMALIIRGVLAQHYAQTMQSQEALRASEELFRTSFQGATTGCCLVDESGRFINVNETLTAMLGYSAEEFAGLRFNDITHPDDRHLGTEFVTSALAGRASRSLLEKRYIRKDGTVVWAIVATGLALPSSPARKAFFITHIQDITERKADERRLRDLNRIYAVLSSINTMIIRESDPRVILSEACRIAVERGQFQMAWVGLCDETGRWLRPAAWAGAVDGYLDTIDIDLHRPLADAGPTGRAFVTGLRYVCDDVATDPVMARKRDAALQRGYRSSVSLPLIVSGRTIGTITLLANEPEFFDAEEVAALDELATDIAFAIEVQEREAERRRAEASLRQSEASNRVLEEQVRQAQKMEAIGLLAGGIAHDFNNILGAMMLVTDLALEDQGMSASEREYLQNIRGFADRAAGLTSQLLTFSRRQVLQSRDIDVNEALSHLSDMLRRIIGEDVSLQLHQRRADLVVHADPSMLDQIVLNLSVNARDAMPAGGRLSIETSEVIVDGNGGRKHADATPGRYVSIAVQDTGGGIAPDVLPRIFEPFFTTKEPGKGTGLGLATVFGIVRQHGGWIDVASDVGKGTSISVFLPAVQTKPVSDEATAAPRVAERPRGGAETILVVEDEDGVRRLTRDVLKRAGYRVIEAIDGPSALAAIAGHAGTVDLVITDMVMPGGLTGREVAAKIVERVAEVRIIFTSGYSGDIAGQELVLKAGEYFVQKPYSSRGLLEVVRRCLDESQLVTNPGGSP